jgi:hypothetical protein
MDKLFFSQFLCCFPHFAKCLFSLLAHDLPSDMLPLFMVRLLNLRCIVRVRKLPLVLVENDWRLTSQLRQGVAKYVPMASLGIITLSTIYYFKACDE